jgi:hypothetical protein
MRCNCPASVLSWYMMSAACMGPLARPWDPKVQGSAVWTHCTEQQSYVVDTKLCGLVVRVPGYTTEMYCPSCEVRTEFMYVMQNKVDRLCGLAVRVPGYRSRGPGSIPGANTFYEK